MHGETMKQKSHMMMLPHSVNQEQDDLIFLWSLHVGHPHCLETVTGFSGGQRVGMCPVGREKNWRVCEKTVRRCFRMLF